jgi:hypothetical protein
MIVLEMLPSPVPAELPKALIFLKYSRSIQANGIVAYVIIGHDLLLSNHQNIKCCIFCVAETR